MNFDNFPLSFRIFYVLLISFLIYHFGLDNRYLKIREIVKSVNVKVLRLLESLKSISLEAQMKVEKKAEKKVKKKVKKKVEKKAEYKVEGREKR